MILLTDDKIQLQNKTGKKPRQGFFKFLETKQHLKALKNYIDLKKL